MFFTKNKRSLTVYVTHYAPFIMKSVTKALDKDEDQLAMTVAYAEKYYTVKFNAALEAVGLTQPTQALDLVAFIALINQIKQQCSLSKNRIRLVCDVNLGDIGGYYVTERFNDLVAFIRPHSLIPFTDTSECRPDAQLYLRGALTFNNLRLPREPVSGRLSSRHDLQAAIQQEIETPTIIHRKSPCLSFFRNRICTKRQYESETQIVPNDSECVSPITPNLTYETLTPL